MQSNPWFWLHIGGACQTGDYWSFGVMIYAMICAEWPFTIRTGPRHYRNAAVGSRLFLEILLDKVELNVPQSIMEMPVTQLAQ